VGWVWDSTAPNQPVRVDLYVGDRRRTTLVADHIPPRSLAAGKGDGRHGFAFTLPERRARGSPCACCWRGPTSSSSAARPWPSDIPMPPLEMIQTVGLQSEQDLVLNGRGTLQACRRFGRLKPDGTCSTWAAASAGSRSRSRASSARRAATTAST
jgi:hypothetical protein